MIHQIIGEESVCSECGSMLQVNIDIGDGFLYDICQGCGFKRKKKKNGETVETIALSEIIRHAESKRKDENRELV